MPPQSGQARQSASQARLNPIWYSYACITVLAAVILGNLMRWGFLDYPDPYHCGALLTTGRWLDPGTYKVWQPEGCYQQALKGTEISQCLTGTTSNTRGLTGRHDRRAVFIGDSNVRQLYFAAVRAIDGGKNYTPKWEKDGDKHTNRGAVVKSKDGHRLNLDFWWDPYLNSTETVAFLKSTPKEPLSMLVMGSGLWYLRNPSSGGLSAWTTAIHSTFDQLREHQGQPDAALQTPWDTMDQSLEFRMPGLLPSSAPARSKDKPNAENNFALADTVVFLPVPDPVDEKLSPERAATILHSDVEAMNADLSARLQHENPPPVVLPTVLNDLIVDSESDDGLHFSDKIMNKQAEILLSWRCADALRKDGMGQPSTCCRRYSYVRPLQGLLLLFLSVWSPLVAYFGHKLPAHSPFQRFVPGTKAALAMSTFGLSVTYLWFTDRTTMFLKENKDWDPKVFTILSALCLVAGLATVRNRGKDLGFLNRDLTDEWKGWMQIAILIYHFVGASKISGIYNPIRVLVAAYLFMTGYGHFFFYYKKAGFGLQRVATVLVRLNLLSVVLPYTMNTNYVFYYFAPLVSWWYLIIYGVMALGSQYNDRAAFLLPKLVLSAIAIAAFMHYSFLMEYLFAFLNAVFKIQWTAREWTFRVTLDLYIVWGGMLTAYAYIKAKEHRLTEQPYFNQLRGGACVASVAALVWYFWYELHLESKFVYNKYHAYVSIVPILGYVVLRNASARLRQHSSLLFCWVGQISLETFILQFHGWLAADTKAILLVLPPEYRPVNLAISTVCFIYLSWLVSGATGEITTWIIGKGKGKERLPPPATAPTQQDEIPLMDRAKEGEEAEGDSGSGSGSAEQPLETPASPNTALDNSGYFRDNGAAVTGYDAPVRWSQHTVLSVVSNIRSLAQAHLSVKLGLVLLVHILLTGACGRIGTHTLSHLLESGHTVLATDVVALPSTLPTTAAGFTPSLPHPSLTFLKGDLTDLSFVDSLFKDKFDGVIHLGAIPNPRDDLDDRKLHAINVCSSYNILRTSTDHNIKRLVQASSVNAHGLSFSSDGHTSFSHFPIDEDVEKKPEDAYAISKAECELQATAICRWAPGTRVASLRFHMVRETYETAWPDCTSTDIFSWVSYESCARACVLALTKGDWAGHEVFNIVAPETCWEGSVERQRKKGEEGGERAGTVELLKRYWPDGEIDEEYFGKNARAAAWTSAKAERVLGWSHDPPKTE